MKIKFIVLLIIVSGIIQINFPQSTFRSGVFLHHSTGNRVWDFTLYDPNYTGATIPSEIENYNLSKNLTGENAVSMNESWFPSSESGLGNDWFNWHWIFDNLEPQANIYPYLDNNKIIVIKSCGPSALMTGYGSPDDTTGSNVTAKTIYNYKWHWRSIVRIMENHPENFFVIWTGTPVPERDSNIPQALLCHEFNTWAKDTLAAGLDETYGDFPPNVFVWDWFHRICDENYFLRPEFVTSPEDGHPNELVSDLMAPLFVQEIFDAAIAYEPIVPVELTSFSATINSDVVKLIWQTATELNNLGFEIQRSYENSEWENIGFVRGNGTSAVINNYSFSDPIKYFDQKCYYRLKQINNDGTFEFSNVIEVDLGVPTKSELFQNYPNPFNPSTEINFLLAKSGYVKLIVFNNLGAEVATLFEGFKNAGNYSINFNADNISSGIYFYSILTDDFKSTRKMLILK